MTEQPPEEPPEGARRPGAEAPDRESPDSLCELVDRLGEAAPPGRGASVETLLETIGTRSFGPLLLVAGLVAFSPLSGIPGVPTLVGLAVVLVSVQMLTRRPHFRLPAWIARRRVDGEKLHAGLKGMRAPARVIDRLLKPRLVALVEGPALYGIASLCIAIALLMPPLELVPFSATLAGAMLASLGLALMSRDGLFGLIAVLVVGGLAVALAQIVL